MALSRVKVWIAGEVLTASDLNAEFNNIINNTSSLFSPLTAGLDCDGFGLTLDAAAVTTLTSTAAIGLSITTGAKAGTPGTTGSIFNTTAHTFTDSATAGSGTAALYTGVAIGRPTLAATNASVTTTDAATLYIPNAPAAGSNETITNAWALLVAAGAVKFAGAATLGSTLALTGAATLSSTLGVTGAATLSSTLAVTGAATLTGGIVGTTTNNDATAGNVGEEIEGVVTSGTPVSLTTTVAANMTSVSLTAGDWDVSAHVNFKSAATTSLTALVAGFSTTSATFDATVGRQFGLGYNAGFVPGTVGVSVSQGPLRFSLASTTTVYCVVQGNFGVDTLSAYGILRARRMR